LVGILLISFLQAGLINAVAFKVDKEIVTLYDIDEAMNSKKLSKAQAVDYLTIEILKRNAIKKFSISVQKDEVMSQMSQISARNGMDIEQFKQMLASRFIDFDTYYDGLKRQILEQKLFSHISQTSVVKPTDEELIVYYNNNKDMFANAGKIEAIKYSSDNQQQIIKAIQSPIMVIDGVTKVDVVLDLSSQASNISDVINRTKEGSFSSLMQENGLFVAYFVKSRQTTKVAKFEEDKLSLILLNVTRIFLTPGSFSSFDLLPLISLKKTIFRSLSVVSIPLRKFLITLAK
jgi:parvulin-like peptidyl-prolyl isomerase